MGPKKKIDRDCSACRGDTALSGRSAGAAGAVSVVLPVVCCVFKKNSKEVRKQPLQSPHLQNRHAIERQQPTPPLRRQPQMRDAARSLPCNPNPLP